VSDAAPDVTATVVDATAPVTACPRCDAALAADQSWCTACGLAARTRIAPTPNWRRPLVAAVAVGAVAIVALMVAFFALTNNDNPLPPATTPAAAPAPAPSEPTATAPATTAAPAATVPTSTQPPITTAAPTP